MQLSFCKNVISIIKSAMTKQPLDLPEDVDLEEIYKFGQSAQILPLLYHGLQAMPNLFDTLIGLKFFKSSMNYANLAEMQMKELEKVCKALDDKEVSYMKLKGSIIKRYYECPEMRTMGDADILIKLDEREKLQKACE